MVEQFHSSHANSYSSSLAQWGKHRSSLALRCPAPAFPLPFPFGPPWGFSLCLGRGSDVQTFAIWKIHTIWQHDFRWGIILLSAEVNENEVSLKMSQITSIVMYSHYRLEESNRLKVSQSQCAQLRILHSLINGEDEACCLCCSIQSTLLDQNRLPNVALESITDLATHGPSIREHVSFVSFGCHPFSFSLSNLEWFYLLSKTSSHFTSFSFLLLCLTISNSNQNEYFLVCLWLSMLATLGCLQTKPGQLCNSCSPRPTSDPQSLPLRVFVEVDSTPSCHLRHYSAPRSWG